MFFWQRKWKPVTKRGARAVAVVCGDARGPHLRRRGVGAQKADVGRRELAVARTIPEDEAAARATRGSARCRPSRRRDGEGA